MRARRPLLAAALAVPLLAAGGLAQEEEEPESFPVSKRLVEWMLDVGKGYRGAGPDKKLLVFRTLWLAAEDHPRQVPYAAELLAERIDGELGDLFAAIATPNPRDPFAPYGKGSENDDVEALLDRRGEGSELEQVRAYVRFLRALDAQRAGDLAGFVEDLGRRHRRHPWVREQLALVARWDDFAALRDRFGLLDLPGRPGDLAGLARVKVWTADWEEPADGDPRPLVTGGWLVEDGGDVVTVYTDRLREEVFELGSEPAGGAWTFEEEGEGRDPGGPLPRIEERTAEAMALDRLAGGLRDYAERAAHAEAGGLDFPEETLLYAFWADLADRPGLAARLYLLAEVAHRRRAGEGAEGDGLWAAFAAAAAGAR